MEEILKQILTEMQELKANQAKMEQNQAKTDQKVDALSDRIQANDRSYRSEFKKLDQKLDGITEVVAKTMEDVTDIKSKVEKHDNELKVLKGAR